MKRCRHKDKIHRFTSIVCLDCGETPSLGEAADTFNVLIEIRAAEMSMLGVPHHNGEAIGWLDHESNSALHSDACPGWSAGWLAREIATHDDREHRDADAWPWDPSRPVAGQYELAKMHAQDAAIDADNWKLNAQVRATAAKIDAVAARLPPVGALDMPTPDALMTVAPRPLVIRDADDARTLVNFVNFVVRNGDPVSMSEPMTGAELIAACRDIGEQLAAMGTPIDAEKWLAEQENEAVASAPERVDGILTPAETAAGIAAEDELRDPAVTAHNAAVLAKHAGSRVTITRAGGWDPRFGPDHPNNRDPTLEVTGAEPIAALIARSSIGAGLANIRDHGIDAELADLASDLHGDYKEKP